MAFGQGLHTLIKVVNECVVGPWDMPIEHTRPKRTKLNNKARSPTPIGHYKDDLILFSLPLPYGLGQRPSRPKGLPWPYGPRAIHHLGGHINKAKAIDDYFH